MIYLCMLPTQVREQPLFCQPVISYLQHLTFSILGILCGCQVLQLSSTGITLPSYPKAPYAKEEF